MDEFLRSCAFNLCFYILTGVACVFCLPTLFLPRTYFMGVVHGFVKGVFFLEKHILGLNLEVRGAEHLPADGAYILAAKHQSAYETFKLHLIFKDPAIILKRELLKIPLWGQYLKKSDPIAIDRSSPKAAIASINEGARRVAADGRPIVIFPQGTRVSINQSVAEKPYKIGVARIQETTGLPIIPMAINAGFFWPKHRWIKKSGTVVFSFLPPITPTGDAGATLKVLENALETESYKLLEEASESKSYDVKKRSWKTGGLIALVLAIILLFGVYSFAWFTVAKQTKVQYVQMLENVTGGRDIYQPPKVTGYPGKMHLYVEAEKVQTDEGTLSIENLSVEGWPIPNVPIHVKTGAISLQYFRWRSPVLFDAVEGSFTMSGTKVNILESTLIQESDYGRFTGNVVGEIDMNQRPAPLIDLKVSLDDPFAFLQGLIAGGIVEERMGLFAGAALESFKNGSGVVTVPVYQKDFKLFVGPIPVFVFDQPLEYDRELGVQLHPTQ